MKSIKRTLEVERIFEGEFKVVPPHLKSFYDYFDPTRYGNCYSVTFWNSNIISYCFKVALFDRLREDSANNEEDKDEIN